MHHSQTETEITKPGAITEPACYASILGVLLGRTTNKTRQDKTRRPVKLLLYYMLVQWNVIMYADVTFPLTLVSNKLNVPFFSTLFQWDKNCNCFQMYFWRNCAKIVSKFENHNSQEPISQPGLKVWFYRTTIQWQVLIKFTTEAPIFPIGNTYRRYCIISVIIRFI